MVLDRNVIDPAFTTAPPPPPPPPSPGPPKPAGPPAPPAPPPSPLGVLFVRDSVAPAGWKIAALPPLPPFTAVPAAPAVPPPSRGVSGLIVTVPPLTSSSAV